MPSGVLSVSVPAWAASSTTFFTCEVKEFGFVSVTLTSLLPPGTRFAQPVAVIDRLLVVVSVDAGREPVPPLVQYARATAVTLRAATRPTSNFARRLLRMR